MKTLSDTIAWEFYNNLPAAAEYARKVSLACQRNGNVGDALIYKQVEQSLRAKHEENRHQPYRSIEE